MPLSTLTEHITVDNMASNEAKWNWPCYNKFGMDKLDKAKRRRKEDDTKSKCGDESSAKHICPQCKSLNKICALMCKMAGWFGNYFHEYN